MDEQWRTIIGFEDYEASDSGRIRSKPFMRSDKNGRRYSSRGTVLTEMVQAGKGYKRVNVYRGGKMFQLGVHCLVCRAFYGEPHGRYVNHIDFDVTNNDVSNLEYVTAAENIRHSANHGRLPGKKGSANPAAKLSANEVLRIADRIRDYEDDQTIARTYGVCRGAITAIRLGKTWGQLTGFHSRSNRLVRGSSAAMAMLERGLSLTFICKEPSTGVARYAISEQQYV
jgi:hypothetical protein